MKAFKDCFLFAASVVALTGALSLPGCGEEPNTDATHMPEPVTAEQLASTSCTTSCPVNPEGSSYLDCDRVAANGCEVEPYSDPLNCGACGVVCPATHAYCIQKRCCDPATRECL